MQTIDARGLACPQPVLLTKQAADAGQNEFSVLVDNQVAKENISRFAKKAGFNLSFSENDGEFEIKLSK